MKALLSTVAGLAWLTTAAPVLAQDHSGHEGYAAPAPATAPSPAPSPPPLPAAVDPHSGHAVPPAADAPSGAMDHGAMDHGSMDHGSMNHGAMDHGAMGQANAVQVSPGPTVETPPPPEAGSGPPRAADAIWGAEAMRASRADLKTHGDFPLFWFQADRAEVQVSDGEDQFLWDTQGYYGSPTRRLWFKSEGEGSFAEGIDDAEVQALYSQAVSPYFDLQAGARQDFGGAETTYATLGVQGMAPYQFELDAALFLSHRGDLTARIEAELDERITQRLILQPRAEVSLAAQDVPQLGIGVGLDKVELGLRLRYEIVREFAPYIGIEQSWRLGHSADFARAAGADPRTTSLVAGIRFWF
ncbi:copper resistance protein B [Alteraurantiacibacter buctensis]|uniref:Copper resistance protein B n=1 Tax=Alteraurantiacibacter buctensis TaxID=1503981 RepID=A0A844YTT9_9SPHN|nr:copper resistance protein B [Alteraurantiacibacter buctensis]MXO70969.1 copper resistance protein B [Alteraurantiacibacter buctensis]